MLLIRCTKRFEIPPMLTKTTNNDTDADGCWWWWGPTDVYMTNHCWSRDNVKMILVPRKVLDSNGIFKWFSGWSHRIGLSIYFDRIVLAGLHFPHLYFYEYMSLWMFVCFCLQCSFFSASLSYFNRRSITLLPLLLLLFNCLCMRSGFCVLFKLRISKTRFHRYTYIIYVLCCCCCWAILCWRKTNGFFRFFE